MSTHGSNPQQRRLTSRVVTGLYGTVSIAALAVLVFTVECPPTAGVAATAATRAGIRHITAVQPAGDGACHRIEQGFIVTSRWQGRQTSRTVCVSDLPWRRLGRPRLPRTGG